MSGPTLTGSRSDPHRPATRRRRIHGPLHRGPLGPRVRQDDRHRGPHRSPREPWRRTGSDPGPDLHAVRRRRDPRQTLGADREHAAARVDVTTFHGLALWLVAASDPSFSTENPTRVATEAEEAAIFETLFEVRLGAPMSQARKRFGIWSVNSRRGASSCRPASRCASCCSGSGTAGCCRCGR